MIVADSILTPSSKAFTATPDKIRRAQYGSTPEVFADIYEEETNIVVWQRDLSNSLSDTVKDFLAANPGFQSSMTVTPDSALVSLSESLGGSGQSELCEDIAELVEMFCCLFDLKRAGLRMTALDRAMCPRFHVDRVPCRLVTTYEGIATEWLPHEIVNRKKLGRGSEGQSDRKSGLFQNQGDIQQLHSGDVALLKGELWEGNENAGLVHRSPGLPTGENRLLLTLDFSD